MLLKLLALLIGTFCCSTAVIFIRFSNEHPIWLSTWRLLFAVILLSPIFIYHYQKHKDKYPLKNIWQSAIPGIMLGLHFISWIYAARMTTAANASLIVNLVPIAMPFFLYFMIREKLNKAEWIGTFFTTIGVIILSIEDLNLDHQYFIGDMICLLSMIMICIYLVYARKFKEVPSLWLYIVPVYLFAGIFSAAVALVLRIPILESYDGQELLMIASLVFVPTIIGHTLLNYSMKYIRGQIVGILNILQFVFAGIMAWILLNEIPGPFFYLASALVMAGAVISIRK